MLILKLVIIDSTTIEPAILETRVDIPVSECASVRQIVNTNRKITDRAISLFLLLLGSLVVQTFRFDMHIDIPIKIKSVALK